jgi:adenylyl-sulfate kinase
MRILIAGFPHSGTSILRKVIGNHPDVFDFHESETAIYQPDTRWQARLGLRRRYEGRNHVVFKWPFHDVLDVTNADRIIWIIRDPQDVFGSLRQRFSSCVPPDHSAQAWQEYASFFLSIPECERYYRLRYEDMFGRNYVKLRHLFGWLGLKWDNIVTRTESRFAPIRYAGTLPRSAPARTEHNAFRAWQTSQAFESKSGQSRAFLDAATQRMLAGMPECEELGYRVDCNVPAAVAKTACHAAPRPANVIAPRIAVVGKSTQVPAFLQQAGRPHAPDLPRESDLPRALAPMADHGGGILWLTGLPGSGKTTLAGELAQCMKARGYSVFVLDGDALRSGLNTDLGFSTVDRDESVRRAGEVAALVARQGTIVIAAFISPRRAARDRLRQLHGGLFREVWLSAPLSTCESRDPKGLYARARRGEIAEFTGVGAPYETPQAADLVLDTGRESIEHCTRLLFAYAESQFLRRAPAPRVSGEAAGRR